MRVQARSQFSVILMFFLERRLIATRKAATNTFISTHEEFDSQNNTPDSGNAICYTALIAKWMQSFRI
jgi:hypothetical protein